MWSRHASSVWAKWWWRREWVCELFLSFNSILSVIIWSTISSFFFSLDTFLSCPRRLSLLKKERFPFFILNNIAHINNILCMYVLVKNKNNEWFSHIVHNNNINLIITCLCYFCLVFPKIDFFSFYSRS